MKLNSLFVGGACAAALAFCVPLTASAKQNESATPAEASVSPSASPVKERALPYHGMISEVDLSAKTFTIAGKEASRVFKVTDRTNIMKDGHPATLNDLAAKLEVRGSYWKNADGTMEAKSVKLGARAEKKKSKSVEASPSPSATP